MRRFLVVLLSVVIGLTGAAFARPAAAAVGDLQARDFSISPAAVLRGQTVAVRFQVGVESAGGGFVPRAWEIVVLQFAPHKTDWSSFAQLTADSLGRVDLDVIPKESGHWRLVSWNDAVLAEPVFVQVTLAKPRVASFDAGPEPVRKGRTLTVKGRLIFQTIRNVSPTARAEIWFTAKGTKTWNRVATTALDGRGGFRKTFKAARDGSWRIRYAGDEHYAALTSPADYVDVR